MKLLVWNDDEDDDKDDDEDYDIDDDVDDNDDDNNNDNDLNSTSKDEHDKENHGKINNIHIRDFLSTFADPPPCPYPLLSKLII